MARSRMYESVKTWNPFKGCKFACTYCVPSFQRQAKRQMHLCRKCYDYKPHEHPDRLDKIPSSGTIFVSGNADISFASPRYVRRILDAIKRHNTRAPHKTYYLQSKRPECFQPYLDELPANVILLTTLETNRDDGYKRVSLAPPPSVRYKQFAALKYSRKVVTVEPIMDFDAAVFTKWITSLKPEYVWIGFNSHPDNVTYPEPSRAKVEGLIVALERRGIRVVRKEMR